MDISKHVTEKFLRANPNVTFVFGDNLIRQGKGGAAKLRDEPNTYGFITKKAPNNDYESFYRPSDYIDVFYAELLQLAKEIEKNPERTYIVSKLGGGLANRYKIYEIIIEPGLKKLELFENVILM